LAQAIWVQDKRCTSNFVAPSSLASKMRAAAFAVACAIFGTARGVELTEATWEAATSGKSVFVKFQAPW